MNTGSSLHTNRIAPAVATLSRHPGAAPFITYWTQTGQEVFVGAQGSAGCARVRQINANALAIRWTWDFRL